jgi:predicted permease
MKKSQSINPRTLKGTGYIIGAIIGIVVAITAFVFTGNIAISIPLFAGLSIPLGMSIEQKLQVETKEKNTDTMKITITLIAIGVLLFSSILSITKII